MDIVITYVDGLDPAWQRDYEQYTNQPVLEKRFRDWGTLPYLFRGIADNMPFIRKVHLVVSHDSQVPAWINREQVHIVLHQDIIPQEFLPTFNSTAIEMFLHRIEDLDEEFLYFNDDMYPMQECKPEDFFRDGKGVIGMSSHLWPSNMYKTHCRSSYRAACQAKLDILVQQQADLSTAIEELIEDIEAGRKYMKVYRQMKMYNDPALNPILYAKKQ